MGSVQGSTFRRVHLSPTQRDELARWEEFEDQLVAEVSKRNVETEMRPPFDTARGYLKRELYRYVCERLDQKAAVALEWCIEETREGRLPRRPTFKQNPFHWALLGLQNRPELNLRKGEISRFGRQLLYARRHRVPAHFLIGFIYQTGSPALINRKLADDEREPWLPEMDS
jgi:hypothetical protein